ISKTINMPNEVTIDDIKDAYMKSWQYGLKAVALYRDGSKMSQVLSSSSDEGDDDDYETKDAASNAKVAEASVQLDEMTPDVFHQTVAPRLRRRPLPKKRRGLTYEARVGGQKVYLRTGEYDNGDLGEVFIDMNKEGATMRSIMNCFAIAVSKGLQYGVPLEEFVNTFTFTRFEPQGIVQGHENIKFATSVIDFVFRTLGFEYNGRTDFLQVKPEEMLDHSPVIDDTGHIQVKKPDAETVIQRRESAPAKAKAKAHKPHDAMDEALSDMMGDAPMCDACGHVTVRNGACYKCLNCGNSMGCS
ncbi:MAG: vitamin B12-dependent ribonucleotide reductase, partial [Planctomycetes bacterium]|nr:vitamin B12-dependent ribonucleotide reductase [Planctomycetota bacterium]